MKAQTTLFDIIRKKLPAHLRLADVIGDLLEIGSDSSYRRIRGEKELTLSELIKLCNYFNISIDSIVGNRNNDIVFKYNPLDLTDLNNYRVYIKQFTESVFVLTNAKKKEIYYTAEDIPIFHFLPFHELTFFKVYVWHNAISDKDITYEKFVQEIKNKEELFECYDKMYKSYSYIPSTEIWTTNTIDPILRLLEYYYDIGTFENTGTAAMLCNQLLQMVDNLIKWTDTGKKEDLADFKLYLSETHPENSFMLLKNDGVTSVTIKLLTINSIITTTPSFCEETEKWIRNTITKSTLLSGASARERFKFFQTMKTKIDNVMERFEN